MRILLVEDDSRVARLVSQALREQAYAAAAAAGGEDALYKASVNDYDAVILATRTSRAPRESAPISYSPTTHSPSP
jgi:DNA-binding response OmpR family regulator